MLRDEAEYERWLDASRSSLPDDLRHAFARLARHYIPTRYPRCVA